MTDDEGDWDDWLDDDAETVAVPIDHVASGTCALGYIRDGHPHGPTIYTAPATFIIGDAWITLLPGQERWVQVPAGVEPRRATEADLRPVE